MDSTVDAATIANTVSVDANEIPAPVTADDTVDVVEDVSLSATKTFSDATVAAGSTGHTFTLVVSNGGASDADNVTIDDVVADELVVTSVTSPDADCSTSSGPDDQLHDSKPPRRRSITVTVGYDVAVSAEPATVSNSMAVGSDEAAVSASDSIDVIEDVALEMTKTFTDSTVAAGVSGNTFSITLTNTGMSDAEAVSITDTVAPELAVTSVTSPDADCSASTGQVVDCAIPSLAPGGSATLRVTYDVDESAAPGTVSNTANASSDEDTTSATDSIEVVEDVDLAVTKTFSPDGAVAGSSGNSFTIVVTNLGVSDADNVHIIDAVDPALTVTGLAAAPAGDCSATIGNTVDSTVAVLTAGAAVTLTVTYDVPSATDASTIPNTARATSDEVGPITGSDDVAITEDVSLAASKTFDATTVVAGSTGHSFTIDIANSGISTADSVAIVDTVASALDVTSVSISPVGGLLGVVRQLGRLHHHSARRRADSDGHRHLRRAPRHRQRRRRQHRLGRQRRARLPTRADRHHRRHRGRRSQRDESVRTCHGCRRHERAPVHDRGDQPRNVRCRQRDDHRHRRHHADRHLCVDRAGRFVRTGRGERRRLRARLTRPRCDRRRDRQLRRAGQRDRCHDRQHGRRGL